MVIAGWNYDVGSFDSVEAIDLTSEIQSCLSPSGYPFSGTYHVGTMLDGVPLVCGGYDDDRDIGTDECYWYNYNDNVWVPTSQNMLESRYAPAASLIDSATWLISGGQNEIWETVDSTEVYKDGRFSYGPTLPTVRFGHCQVTLNTSHIAILGGSNGTNSLTDFYLLDWDDQSWHSMPDLPWDILYDICGLIENSVNGQELVVFDNYASCQIFNFEENAWKEGPLLPDDTKLFENSLVAQMEQTFYILGGRFEGEISSDVVYKFDQENYEWVRQSFVLSNPIEGGVAIPVPDNVVHCLNK